RRRPAFPLRISPTGPGASSRATVGSRVVRGNAANPPPVDNAVENSVQNPVPRWRTRLRAVHHLVEKGWMQPASSALTCDDVRPRAVDENLLTEFLRCGRLGWRMWLSRTTGGR